MGRSTLRRLRARDVSLMVVGRVQAGEMGPLVVRVEMENACVGSGFSQTTGRRLCFSWCRFFDVSQTFTFDRTLKSWIIDLSYV